MKMYLCRHPGCGELIIEMGYCDKHRPEHEKKVADFKARKVSENVTWQGMYNNARWRRERSAFLRVNPFCVCCGAPATIVDHIHAHRGNEEAFWNQDNWQSLCRSCHSKKTERELRARHLYRSNKNQS